MARTLQTSDWDPRKEGAGRWTVDEAQARYVQDETTMAKFQRELEDALGAGEVSSLYHD